MNPSPAEFCNNTRRIMSRDHDRQTAEIRIRIAIMNRFAALRRTVPATPDVDLVDPPAICPMAASLQMKPLFDLSGIMLDPATGCGVSW